MKLLLTTLTSLALTAALFTTDPPTQDPTHRRVLIENVTDCNWLFDNVKGHIKIRAPKTSNVSFRAYHPYLQDQVEYGGMVIYRQLYLWVRDYMIMRNGSVFFDHSHLPNHLPFGWWFALHYNELSGVGCPNAGTRIHIKGPAWMALYDGTADVTFGDGTTIRVVVIEGVDPPWMVQI
jgi:hypothetical protein